MFQNLIPKDRQFFFYGDVDQRSILKLSSSVIEVVNSDIQLTKLYPVLLGQDFSPPPIHVYIESYGGDVHSCLGLMSVIEASTTPIYTIVTGTAMSAGMMLSVVGHKRFCYPNSTFMYHQSSMETAGTLRSNQEIINEVHKLDARLDEILLRVTKISKKKIADVIARKQDWHINAEEALKLGVVDHIIKSQDELF